MAIIKALRAKCCLKATSNKTRIETLDPMRYNQDIQGLKATSNKTRIETT